MDIYIKENLSDKELKDIQAKDFKFSEMKFKNKKLKKLPDNVKRKRIELYLQLNIMFMGVLNFIV